MTKLTNIGGCYSPAQTLGSFRVKRNFIKIYLPEFSHVRSRLLICTPKAWEKIRNHQELLTKLSQDIGMDGKGEITRQTIAALQENGFIIEVFANNKAGFFGLQLEGLVETDLYERTFKELKEPTDNNINLVKTVFGYDLGFLSVLSLPQRKQLLHFLHDAGIKFAQVVKIEIIPGKLICLEELGNNSFNVKFGDDSSYPAKGILSWK